MSGEKRKKERNRKRKKEKKKTVHLRSPSASEHASLALISRTLFTYVLISS